MQGRGDDERGFDLGVYEAEDRLALADDDDALPWLESDDDYEQDDSFDARMIVMALLVLVVVMGLLAAAWFALTGNSDPELEPDGSIIEAPDAPYKTRPSDPGGTQVAGTGDMSYQVGEGEGREGVIADDAPPPPIDRRSVAEQADEDPDPAPTAQVAMSGVGVQVGAFSTRALAEAGWSQLNQRYEALHGVSHRVIEGVADSGTIYRLQAVAGNVEGAEQLCRAIRNAGGDCQVKR